jgi:putative transposase
MGVPEHRGGNTVSASAYVRLFGDEADYAGYVQLRYSYRLYPTPGQQQALARAFGCARVVFNDALAARQAARASGEPYLSDAALSAALTAAKADPERAWLGEVSSVVLQQALADLNTAYRNFFASVTGKRRGRKVGPPRFRSRKDGRQAIRFTANARFKVLDDGRLRLPKVGDLEVRWSRAQRDLSRKQKGGRNRNKARVKVARAHARVAGARRDFHHKASTKVIRENQAVYVENLAVKGLARTRLAKSVYDAGWSAFTGMLEYKARLYGREFHKIGRFEPTSQVCSACGARDGPKPLSVREWECKECGTVHDRDVNAARNILAAGRADKQNACGGQVRPAATPAQARETGSLRGAA